jgi:hypothetical protein
MERTGAANIELAQHLSERKPEADSRMHQIIEIVEALVLAIVAVATAWSGYQAALWAGNQAERYTEANTLRVDAEGAATIANQERLYDALTVVEWIKAQAHGEKKLAEIFERRLLPEFRPAFEAWKKTDPLNSPQAPVGPQQMREYHSANSERAVRLHQLASATFEQGNQARRHSDDYVRVTVMLATVLLLTAISQRFKTHAVRVGLAGMATVLLCIPLYRILMLPRV